MKKKVFIIFIVVILISILSYAKYKIDYSIEAIQIITDLELPNCKVSYSTTDYTNQNVDVILEFSEEIKPIEGFTKINNVKYKKILTNNKAEKIEFFDLAGNSNSIEYNVSWIDKQSPKINGIENGKTYMETKKVTYTDNLSGVANIEKVFYGDLEIGIIDYIQTQNYIELTLKILRKNKNINQIIFYKIESGVNQINKIAKDIFTYRIQSLEKVEFYVEVIDSSGNKYKSKSINKNNLNDFINISKNYSTEDNNTFSNPGNYDIIVTDKANNKVSYTIKIEK